ncbi:cytochrome P450 [Haliea sp. E1-2-M8]|uniref:cytochrome P450 n=1 Tax=Haliea sp. E1-2-M8 TaxID=3064706 RepID=UPI00272755CB|nr:cytochrome P450 [Haliea sp. E1-2-M8]MDO8860754.1 cytochrome P450 [Haliea sp. E1-2-M8]
MASVLTNARALFSAEALENPYPLYTTMRSLGPVCQLGSTRAFFVGTHAAVTEVVMRHEDFSANLERMLVRGDDGKPRVFDLAGAGHASNVLATADEPEHAVHRRMLVQPLKAAAIAALEPAMRALAAERVDSLVAAGGGDFCAALAEPLPAWVVSRLLGLGDHALEAVQRWAMMGGDFLAGTLDADRLATVLTETGHQHAYLEAHLDAVAGSHDDSLTAVLAGAVESGLITKQQAVGMLVILFGAAGESTASLLGSAVRLFAEDAELQQRLRVDPGLIPGFLEEVVRLETPFKFHYRVVRRETRLCGTVLKPDDLLVVSWAAANRDPEQWPDPEILLLERPAGARHLGFGYGIHFCIGAPLARLEARVALEELLARSRRIALDAARSPEHVPSLFVRRLRYLYLKMT